MDEQHISSAHIVGNSMGGRIALEMGMTAPERVRGLGLLCPAVAWVKRGLHPLVRLLRPEFGLLPHGFSRGTVASQVGSMLYDQDLLDPAVADVMVDEFRRIYHSAGARLAFLASARNIYLEAPYGRRGFYPRLSELDCPALFIWGSHDRLIPAGFSRHVAKWLPDAEQVTLDACGHIPQVERPEETNERLLDFFTRVEAIERGGRPPLPASTGGQKKRRQSDGRQESAVGPLDEAA
jgi:pimeloyl-ACP methyl ester carboxylesterase